MVDRPKCLQCPHSTACPCDSCLTFGTGGLRCKHPSLGDRAISMGANDPEAPSWCPLDPEDDKDQTP